MMSNELTVLPVLLVITKKAAEPVALIFWVVKEDRLNGTPGLAQKFPPLPLTVGQMVAAVRLTMSALARGADTDPIRSIASAAKTTIRVVNSLAVFTWLHP